MMDAFNRTFNKDNSDHATTVLRDDEEHRGSCHIDDMHKLSYWLVSTKNRCQQDSVTCVYICIYPIITSGHF